MDGEEPVGRTHPLKPLMRPLVVVVFHPQPNAFPRLLEGGELRPDQELLPDRFPEPFDFTQRHRMMRLAAQVVDPILLQFHLEPGLAPPRSVLPPIVGEHFLGYAIFTHGGAIHLQHIFGGLAAEHIQPDHVARMVIDEPDQVGILPAQPEAKDVALPQLVGGGTLEEPRLRRVLRWPLRLGLGQQLMPMQSLSHSLRAGRQQQHPPHPLGNAPDPEARLLLLDAHDLGLYGGG